MELRLPTEAEFETAYRRDLKPAFPAAELAPLHALQKLIREGTYHPWCLFDGGELLGETCTYEASPGFVLFDYLCVTEARRNDGLGSLLIERLIEAERGSVVFGESEIPAYAPDAAMAERRLGFYRRNGAMQADYDTCIFGVPYHTLYWSERPVTGEEICAAHESAYRSRFPRPIYKKYIRIPWDISMGPPKKIPWLE